MSIYSMIHDLFYGYLDELYAVEYHSIHGVTWVLPHLNQPMYHDALMLYRIESIRHRDLLHTVFESLERHPADHACIPVNSMLNELKQTIQRNQSSLVRDLRILSVVHHLCHYGLAHYQWLAQWAERANHLEIAATFTTIQHQKIYAAHILTRLNDQGLQHSLPSQLDAQERGGFRHVPNQTTPIHQKR